MIETTFLTVPILIGVAYWMYRSLVGPWACRVAAREIGGTVGSGSPENVAYVEGTLDGYRLKAGVGRIRVEAGDSLPPVRLKLSRQGPVAYRPPLARLLSLDGEEAPSIGDVMADTFKGRGQDVIVGDSAFDSAVVVDGQEVNALAALDAPTRGCVIGLMHLGIGQITVNPWEIVAEGAVVSNGQDLVRRMKEVVGLMKAMARRGSYAERLAANSRADPVADVRLRNLEVLINQYSEWLGTAQACRASLADPDPWVRLRAAEGLGREGLSVLRELALTSTSNQGLAAAALESLLGIGDREQVASVCLEVLSSGRGAARRRAIETLGRLRHAPALPDLVRALNGKEMPAAAAAARALTLLGGEQAEAALTRAVSRIWDVQTDVIRGLGAIGSIEAIGKLRDLAEGERVSPAVRRFAQSAISQIQSRLTGAEAGQLALADLEPQRGALSVVDPDPEEGRLSMPDQRSAPAPSGPSGLSQGPR